VVVGGVVVSGVVVGVVVLFGVVVGGVVVSGVVVGGVVVSGVVVGGVVVSGVVVGVVVAGVVVGVVVVVLGIEHGWTTTDTVRVWFWACGHDAVTVNVMVPVVFGAPVYAFVFPLGGTVVDTRMTGYVVPFIVAVADTMVIVWLAADSLLPIDHTAKCHGGLQASDAVSTGW
jgi:hypothetical protein